MKILRPTNIPILLVAAAMFTHVGTAFQRVGEGGHAAKTFAEIFLMFGLLCKMSIVGLSVVWLALVVTYFINKRKKAKEPKLAVDNIGDILIPLKARLEKLGIRLQIVLTVFVALNYCFLIVALNHHSKILEKFQPSAYVTLLAVLLVGAIIIIRFFIGRLKKLRQIKSMLNNPKPGVIIGKGGIRILPLLDVFAGSEEDSEGYASIPWTDVRKVLAFANLPLAVRFSLNLPSSWFIIYLKNKMLPVIINRRLLTESPDAQLISGVNQYFEVD